MTLPPNKGIGFFDTPSGRTSIEYAHAGELIATVAGPDALEVVTQIAAEMRAIVRPADDVD